MFVLIPKPEKAPDNAQQDIDIDPDEISGSGILDNAEKQAKKKAKHKLTDRSQKQLAMFDKYRKKYGCPLEALFKMGFDTTLRADLRIGALRVALSRGMPELRSVEVKGNMTTNQAGIINLTVGNGVPNLDAANLAVGQVIDQDMQSSELDDLKGPDGV